LATAHTHSVLNIHGQIHRAPRGPGRLMALGLLCLGLLTSWFFPSSLGAATTPQAYSLAAVIAGHVWQDYHQNGIQDPWEPGLSDVLVVLANETDGSIAYTLTDDTGAYRFEDLTPGAYLVFETDPPSYGSSTPNRVRVSVAAGEMATVDFGDAFLLVGCFRTVYGAVWHDANLDQVQDPTELPLDEVVVRAVDRQGEVQALTVSRAGEYALRNLPPARYHLTFSPPASTPHSTLPVDWAVDLRGCQPLQIDLGFQDQQGSPWRCVADAGQRPAPQGSGSPSMCPAQGATPRISGTAWALGRSGRVPLSGVRTNLLDNGGEFVAHCFSDEGGAYGFGDLSPGYYFLVQQSAEGHDATPCYWGAVIDEDSEVIIDIVHRPLAQIGHERVFIPLLVAF
jgi:uncharacterized surface anchored protein